jgi:hypothetical protein
MMTDDAEGCICRGNWRALVKACEPVLDMRFRDAQGHEYAFFGIVHARDDYYYGMRGVSPDACALRLLSCVGTIAGHGYRGPL